MLTKVRESDLMSGARDESLGSSLSEVPASPSIPYRLTV